MAFAAISSQGFEVPGEGGMLLMIFVCVCVCVCVSDSLRLDCA